MVIVFVFVFFVLFCFSSFHFVYFIVFFLALNREIEIVCVCIWLNQTKPNWTILGKIKKNERKWHCITSPHCNNDDDGDGDGNRACCVCLDEMEIFFCFKNKNREIHFLYIFTYPQKCENKEEEEKKCWSIHNIQAAFMVIKFFIYIWQWLLAVWLSGWLVFWARFFFSRTPKAVVVVGNLNIQTHTQ